jgi:tetratricopeptide (TPR) repeat protein
MVWNIRPDSDDWLEKAETINEDKNRIAFLERAVDLFPEDIPLRRRIIREYISQKEWKKAARILEQEVEKDPDRDMLNELLMVYRKMSYNDGIVSTLRRLLQYDSEDVTYRLELAEALEEKGKWKRAIKEYEMVAGMVNGDDALNVYENLGYLYSKTGMIKKAISAYLKAVKMNPGDANLYYNLSYLYEKAGQTGKADWYLAKAANLKSSDLESRLKLSHRMIMKGQLMRAKRYLSDVLEKDPHSLEALILMSELLEKQRKKSELRKVYKKILAIEPMNDTVLYNLGILEYEERNLKAAMLHMGKYLKLHPEDVAAHEIMLDILVRQDASEKAFEEAKILVRLAPKKMAPYHYIFDYLRLKGRYKEIISVMTKGLQANPKEVKLREYLVLSYLKTGQDSLAVTQMKEILKVRPKDVGLLFDLAVLYEKQEKLSLAMGVYERISKIMPDNEKAEDAYLRLRLEGVQKGGVD